MTLDSPGGRRSSSCPACLSQRRWRRLRPAAGGRRRGAAGRGGVRCWPGGGRRHRPDNSCSAWDDADAHGWPPEQSGLAARRPHASRVRARYRGSRRSAAPRHCGARPSSPGAEEARPVAACAALAPLELELLAAACQAHAGDADEAACHARAALHRERGVVVSNGPARLMMSAGLITMSTGVLAGDVEFAAARGVVDR